MPEIATARNLLQRIPFTVASLTERCTESGSYNREIAERVAQSIRQDIERCLEELWPKGREP